MPIYEYKCPQCENIFEEWVRSHTGTEHANCPHCQAIANQIISNTSFVLKGGGWYVTEYGNRKNQENRGDSEHKSTSDATVSNNNKAEQKNSVKSSENTTAASTEKKILTDTKVSNEKPTTKSDKKATV